MAEHHLLGQSHRIFIVEDEEGVGLHVDPLAPISEGLQPVVEVYHAELRNELAVGFTQLDREAGGLDAHL